MLSEKKLFSFFLLTWCIKIKYKKWQKHNQINKNWHEIEKYKGKI